MTQVARGESALSPDGSVARRNRIVVVALLALILVLAAVLRWRSIDDRALFFDEIWIAELSSGHGSAFYNLPLNQLLDQPNTVALSNALPIWEIPANTTGAIHPPGTFVMLRLWRDVFGDSMLAWRSCSATWSMIVVLLTFIAARLSFGTIAALAAAMMSTLSLANIDQAQDVRGYTMLQAFLLLTVIALLKMRERPSCWRGAIAVGVGTLLMMYTHYFAAGACAATVVGAILLLPRRTRWQTLAAIGVAGLVWIVTWLPHLRAQLAFVPETADIFLKDRSDYPALSTLVRFLTSPYRALVAEPLAVTPSAIIGGLAVIYLLALRFSHRATGGKRTLALFWLVVVAGALGELLLLDLARMTKHLELPKYLVLANPALCVLLGSLAIGPRWLMPTLVCIGLAVMLYLTPFVRKPELRPEMAFLSERAAADDLFIIATDPANPHSAQALYLYIAEAMPWPRHQLYLLVDYASPDLAASLPHGRRWFYLSIDRRYRPEIWLPGTRVVEAGPTGDAGVWEVQPLASPASAPTHH